MDFQLKKIAELLDRGMENEAILNRGRWMKEVHPITRPFLSAIKAALISVDGLASVKWSYATRGSAKRASTIDRIRGVIGKVRVPGIADYLWELGVWIGIDDADKRLDRHLMWGCSIWLKEKPAAALALKMEKETAEEGDFVLPVGSAVFGGVAVLLGRSLDSDTLRSQEGTRLIPTIVSDIRRIHDGIRPQLQTLSDFVIRQHKTRW